MSGANRKSKHIFALYLFNQSIMEELLRLIGLLREKEMEKVLVYDESRDAIRLLAEKKQYNN